MKWMHNVSPGMIYSNRKTPSSQLCPEVFFEIKSKPALWLTNSHLPALPFPDFLYVSMQKWETDRWSHQASHLPTPSLSGQTVLDQTFPNHHNNTNMLRLLRSRWKEIHPEAPPWLNFGARLQQIQKDKREIHLGGKSYNERVEALCVCCHTTLLHFQEKIMCPLHL